MGNRVSSLLKRFCFLGIVISLPLNICAQSKERPKLKDFGSSLKRTRWDPDKQEAVVAKPKSNLKSNDDNDLDVVKVETSLVSSDLLVHDARGNPVDGLTGSDFLISEDGAPQKLGMFSLGANSNVARTIVLIIDYSSSQMPVLETSIAAAKTMIDKLGPLDRMAIVNDDVEMIQDFTTDKEKLKDKLESLRKRTSDSLFSRKRFGKSKQYSALFATLNEAFVNEDRRPIVIFQTDGDQLGFLRNSPTEPFEPADPGQREAVRKVLEQYRTSFSLEDIYRAAERSRVTIYTVVPGFRIIGLSRDEQLKQVKADFEQRWQVMAMATRVKIPDYVRQRFQQPEVLESARQGSVLTQNALASVAITSGGWLMFLERPEQADETYSLILSDMNRRYLVGYYPTNKEHDGKRRNLAVTIRDHPDYKVIGRKWYYAPSPDQ